MSRIDDLIAELCPDGVEHKPLGEIATFARGHGLPKTMLADGDLGAIHYGQIYTRYGIWADSTYSYVDSRAAENLIRVYPGDLILANTSENLEDVGKTVAWMGKSEIVTGGHSTVIRHQQNAKFLAYWFSSQDFHIQKRKFAYGTKVIELPSRKLELLRLPVPPIEVQQEIVRILDKFTQLEAELEAELEARRVQYEYYRSSLFSEISGNESTWLPLASICASISSGGTPTSGKRDYYDGTIPWLRTQEVDFNRIKETGVHITELGLNNSSAKWVPAHCVIVAMYGATAAKVAINDIPLTTNQACCNLEINHSIADYRYVFYWLSSRYEHLKSLGEGTQSNLNAGKIRKFQIPVPPLAEQQRIAVILDKFDALVNDLSVGLPAELNARRQQYEHYRDRLLTFKELPA